MVGDPMHFSEAGHKAMYDFVVNLYPVSPSRTE